MPFSTCLPDQLGRIEGVAGLNKKAARETRGAISLSSSSYLPAIVGSILKKQVTLPRPAAELATKPLLPSQCP
jgi:hypothetical protein